LALRRGSHYVFEPNDDVLQRAVERGFTFLLTDLFRRGAFAGATPVESFRVGIRGMINGKADRDNGRFVVEIRVAPSLPLQFLTIRLTQQGERFRVSEGG
jgi:phage tail sheath protein FI